MSSIADIQSAIEMLRTPQVEPNLTNPIIYRKLAPTFATVADFDRWFTPAVCQRLQLPYAAGWLGGQAFIEMPAQRESKDITAVGCEVSKP